MDQNNPAYITVLDWMTELDLSLTEMTCYAIIYGFSQRNQGLFNGSRTYLASWCRCTTKTIDAALATLRNKGLINKLERYEGGVKFCSYSANFPGREKISLPQGKNFAGGEKNLPTPREKISHNNIEDNIDDNIAATARVRARAGKKDQDILFRDTLVEAGASTANVDKLLYIRKQKRLANTERASAQLVESIKIICQRQGVTTDEVVAFMVNPARNWGAIRPDWDGVEKITANVRRSGKTISVADMISRDNRYFQNAAK